MIQSLANASDVISDVLSNVIGHISKCHVDMWLPPTMENVETKAWIWAL